MRLSADPDDRGYLALVLLRNIGMRVRVFLDGVEQRYVDAVDEEAGFVRLARVDERGNIFAAGDRIARRTIIGGNVQILLEQAS